MGKKFLDALTALGIEYTLGVYKPVRKKKKVRMTPKTNRPGQAEST